MALDVRPRYSVFDARYDALSDSVVTANRGLRSLICPDSMNIVVSKFCHWASCAFMGFPDKYSVLHIAGPSVPSKVFNAVVLSVAVIVAAIKLLWHWPIKGAEYKPVNRAFKGNGISDCKPDMQIPVFRFPRFKQLAIDSFWPSAEVSNNPVFASNIAEIRRGIRTFKSRDWFPNFHNVAFFMAPLCHKKGDYSGS